MSGFSRRVARQGGKNKVAVETANLLAGIGPNLVELEKQIKSVAPNLQQFQEEWGQAFAEVHARLDGIEKRLAALEGKP